MRSTHRAFDRAAVQKLAPGGSHDRTHSPNPARRLGGEYQRWFYSLSVQNLFNTFYYDYAVASTSTFGTFNAYPQPGRVIMGRVGLKFS